MILRTNKNKNYTTLCNVALNDPELSLKAKGLFAFLMSKPDDWRISYRGLAAQLKEGKVAILGALKELEDAGYLQRARHQADDGKLVWQSVLHEQTMGTKPAHGKNGGTTMRRFSTRGKSTHGKPAHIVSTDKPITEKEKLNKSSEAQDHRGKPSATAERMRLAKDKGLRPWEWDKLDEMASVPANGRKTAQKRAAGLRQANKSRSLIIKSVRKRTVSTQTFLK